MGHHGRLSKALCLFYQQYELVSCSPFCSMMNKSTDLLQQSDCSMQSRCLCHQNYHVLQRFMGMSLQLRECQQPNLGFWQHFHHSAISHYSGFLLDLAECLYDEPLTWSFVKG